MEMYKEKNIASLYKKSSVNLHRGTSVLEKWVRWSTRHLQEDVCTTPGTAEVIVQNIHFRSSDTYTYLNGFFCFQ